MHSLVYLFYLVHLVHLQYIVHLDYYVRFLFCNGHEEASGGWAAIIRWQKGAGSLLSMLLPSSLESLRAGSKLSNKVNKKIVS